MLRGLWSAASGMAAQKLTIDVIANNLANVTTAGFKKSRTDFQDLMYQTISESGSTTETGGQIPVGIQVGMGTMPVGVHKIFEQGDFEETKTPPIVSKLYVVISLDLPDNSTPFLEISS